MTRLRRHVIEGCPKKRKILKKVNELVKPLTFRFCIIKELNAKCKNGQKGKQMKKLGGEGK